MIFGFWGAGVQGEAGDSGGVNTGPVVGVEDEITCIKVTQGEGQVFGLSFLGVRMLDGACKLLWVNQLIFGVNYANIPEVGESMICVILAVRINKFRFTTVVDKVNLAKLQFNFGL